MLLLPFNTLILSLPSLFVLSMNKLFTLSLCFFMVGVSSSQISSSSSLMADCLNLCTELYLLSIYRFLLGYQVRSKLAILIVLSFSIDYIFLWFILSFSSLSFFICSYIANKEGVTGIDIDSLQSVSQVSIMEAVLLCFCLTLAISYVCSKYGYCAGNGASPFNFSFNFTPQVYSSIYFLRYAIIYLLTLSAFANYLSACFSLSRRSCSVVLELLTIRF